MTRHLPSIFVILLSAFATTMTLCWWQAHQTNADLERQHASLYADIAQQVDDLQRQNEALRREILLEIEFEIENAGKHDNEKLADTLELLGVVTQMLMDSNTLTMHDLTNWREELRAMFDRDSWNKMGDSPQFPLSTFVSDAQRKLLLLRWERETIRFLSMRVGITHCFGPKANLMIVPRDTLIVKVGKTFDAALFVYWTEELFMPQPHHFFESSQGEVIFRNGLPHLIVPTEGLLRPGESRRLIPVTVRGKIVAQWGQVDIIREEYVFWLVDG